MASFKGTVEPLGMSIFMQGTHKLIDDKGELVALLQGATEAIDLSAYEGQKVEVTGNASPSVEGGSTMVDVESVKKV